MLFRKIILFALVTILVGCAPQTPIKQSESLDSQPISVTFLLPALESAGDPPPSNPQDLARKIRFMNYRHIGSGEYPVIEALQWKIQDNAFTVESFKASMLRSSGSEYNKVSIAYDGTLRMEKSGSNYQMVFSLKTRNYYAEPMIVGGKIRYQVEFNPSDVVANLAKAEMSWKLEVDSQFNSDSTYANFARLARKEIVRGGEKDPVTGKIFKERFWVRLSGREISVNVETYPYRNGSKAVVYATLPGTVSGTTVDFVNATEALKKEIERIVKS